MVFDIFFIFKYKSDVITFGHSRLEDIHKKNVSSLLLYKSFYESDDLIQQNLLNPRISSQEKIHGLPDASSCKWWVGHRGT